MSDIEAVLAEVDADLDNALERLFSLLRIPSISTDPAYADDCVACADHLVADLKSIGFDASRRQTIGLPMVVAHAGPGPDAAAGRASCSTGTTTCSRRTRWRNGTPARSSRRSAKRRRASRSSRAVLPTTRAS